MIHRIFILIQPFADLFCPLDEFTPIRIEIEVIIHNTFALIYSEPSLLEDKFPPTA